jgi:phosphatidate cytidylyltransferase
MKRILSAMLLIPVALAFVAFAPPPVFVAGIGIVGTLCVYEYLQLTRAMGLRCRGWFVYGAVWSTLVVFHTGWLPAPAILSGVLLAGFMASMWTREPLKERALGLMAGLLGVFYPLLCLYPAVPLRFGFGEEAGLHWILTLLVVIWMNDIAALVVGKKLGRTPFSPLISPKKTREGAAGGLMAGILAALLVQVFLFPDLPRLHVLVMSILVGIAGQLGDLAESMIKRAAQVKDSSSLIPGHGGILDRIDSLMFALPVLYIYLLFVHGR